MKTHLKLAAAVALAACAATAAWAQGASDWKPSKPVRIIVPIVGSTNDVLARLIGPKLQEALGQPFVVENKPGAGGNIGAYEVSRAAPDGHTLLIGYNGPLAINVTLFDKMPYDPTKDFAPITLAVKSPQYLVVNPATGITEIARPVGVVCAITPSTNPAATPANKIINALKGRNAVIVAPSPKGWSTCARLIEHIHAQFDRIRQRPGELWRRIFDYRKMLTVPALKVSPLYNSSSRILP